MIAGFFFSNQTWDVESHYKYFGIVNDSQWSSTDHCRVLILQYFLLRKNSMDFFPRRKRYAMLIFFPQSNLHLPNEPINR